MCALPGVNQGSDSWVKSLQDKDLRVIHESERADLGPDSETYVKMNHLKSFIYNALG